MGAKVTGIELARLRCEADDVDVDLREGDAAALTVADATFDVVLSVMGVIFASDRM